MQAQYSAQLLFWVWTIPRQSWSICWCRESCSAPRYFLLGITVFLLKNLEELQNSTESYTLLKSHEMYIFLCYLLTLDSWIKNLIYDDCEVFVSRRAFFKPRLEVVGIEQLAGQFLKFELIPFLSTFVKCDNT